jgi:hypothetical protein
MIRRNLSISLLGLALLFSGCAAKEQTYWEKKKGTIIVHHVRRTSNGTRDRTESLTANTVTPAEVHVYDLGRMPDGNGGMHEAHRYYRVVQSERFDLRLPAEGNLRLSKGPKTAFTPPNYSPPPKSQRINDALAEAKEAKDKLDEARGKIEQQLTTDNNLRAELQTVIDKNQRLQDQINAGFSAPQRAPTPNPSPVSKAAQAGAQAVDPLAQWGQKVSSDQTPQ